MAIASMDDLVAGLVAGQRAAYYKAALVLSANAMWGSFWTVAGQPGPGATPAAGAGAVPTAATAGALPFTNPGGAAVAYLAGLDIEAAVGMGAFLYDRLVHTSGLDGTLLTAQTVNSTALTRPDANGVGAEAYLECYTGLGATGRVATLSYTNPAGTAGQSGSASIPANCKAGQLVPVTLAAGDTGIKSVQTVTLAASTGTAGNFGVTIARRIASMLPGYSTAAGVTRDPFTLGLPVIPNNACLWLVGYGPSVSTIAPISGMFRVAQK